MSRQYHMVVMYDDFTEEFSIEWDTTQHLEEYEGTIWDTEEQAWHSGFGNEEYDDIADKLAKILGALYE